MSCLTTRLFSDKVYQSGFRPSSLWLVARRRADWAACARVLCGQRDTDRSHLVRTAPIAVSITNREMSNFWSAILKRLSADDRVLIVDDAYDTGRTPKRL